MTSTEAIEADVVVIGAGVAGLVAAREAARTGARVVVLEAAEVAGGLVGAHTVGSLVLDIGAESFATRGNAVAGLLEELGLAPAVVTPTRVPARVHVAGVSAPMPATGVLGIPTDLEAPGLLEVLGADGLDLARADLHLSPEVGSGEPTLAGLVRARMGGAVLDRLLRPVVRGVHSVEPEEIGAEDLLPGLRARLAASGSLAAALAGFRAAAPAGSAVQGIEGGMHRLVDALVGDLRAAGVDLRLGANCLAARRAGDGWLLEIEGVGGAPRPVQGYTRRLLLASAPHTWTFLDPAATTGMSSAGERSAGERAAGERAANDRVASDRAANEDSAGPAADGLPGLAAQAARWPSPSGVDLVTLILDAQDLPAHDRAGVLVADPGQGAKALTYLSSKWDWLGRLAGGGQAVLRLSYAAGVLPGPDGAQADRARADACRLLGIEIPAHAVRDHALQHHTLPRPILATGMGERVRQMRESVAATQNLEVAGTWIAGTGLASVIPDARAAGARLAAN